MSNSKFHKKIGDIEDEIQRLGCLKQYAVTDLGLWDIIQGWEKN